MVRIGCGLGTKLGAAAFFSLALSGLPAAAFPTDQATVPLAVGAAFALPAVAALVYYSIARVVRFFGGLLSFAAVALAGLWLLETWSPGLTRDFVDVVWLKWGT